MKEEDESSRVIDFLLTYGWAILVVLAAIGALVYFGVFSPERFIVNNKYEDCMLGCFAGMNYDGIEIKEVDIDDIDDEQLKEFIICQDFCKAYQVQPR